MSVTNMPRPLNGSDSIFRLQEFAPGGVDLRLNGLANDGLLTVDDLLKSDLPMQMRKGWQAGNFGKTSFSRITTILEGQGLRIGASFADQMTAISSMGEEKDSLDNHLSSKGVLFGIKPHINFDHSENLAGHIVGPGVVFHFKNRLDQEKFANTASQVLEQGVAHKAFSSDDLPGAILTIKPERDVEGRVVHSVYVGQHAGAFIAQHALDKSIEISSHKTGTGRG